jgi:hypothetical protein
MWEAATGLNLDVYKRPGEAADAVTFSPDGKFILASLEDDQADLYACDRCYSSADLLALAPAHVTRELTPEEQEKYLHQTRGK